MREAVTAYVALGANLGDAVTTVYRTDPIDSSGPDYINAVGEISTILAAPDLLLQLQRLEQGAGRQRAYRNAPRTLDLDILLFGEGRIESPGLVVPHSRMNGRAFVLVPLAEVAPRLVGQGALHAVSGQAGRPL